MSRDSMSGSGAIAAIGVDDDVESGCAQALLVDDGLAVARKSLETLGERREGLRMDLVPAVAAHL